MNKQSNIYTTIYIIVLVLIVGTALAATSLALKQRQTDNVNADKMRQILASVKIPASGTDAVELFKQHVVKQLIVSSDGTATEGDAFAIDVDKQSRLPQQQRQLPLYVCQLSDGSTKYVIPAYGAGLWGPIWGYVSVDDNGSTIYGAFFAHQGETPGLGAEIEKPDFCNRFDGLNLIKDGQFAPITVVKAGQHPADNRDYVDGVSGGTITSKGVAAMLDNCILPYKAYLEKLGENK